VSDGEELYRLPYDAALLPPYAHYPSIQYVVEIHGHLPLAHPLLPMRGDCLPGQEQMRARGQVAGSDM
jgi:hypothetical protein